MIFDSLKNAEQYAALNERINKVFEAAKNYNSDNFVKGRVDIDGDTIYMNFAEYETKNKADAIAEAHKKYIDVMCMIEGTETIYVKDTAKLSNVTHEYTEEKEALLADLDDDMTPVRLDAGSFVILFPQDAHAPGCVADKPQKVKKIIGKVLIND